jgi:hypothetical protein
MSTYYSGIDWWDTTYKIRRPITLTPFDFLAGTESLCAVKLNRQAILNKVKPDYSDLAVTYFDADAATPTVVQIPFYVFEESASTLSIIFESQTAVTDLSTDYTLYYSAKAESRLNDAADILDPANLTLSDTAQQDQTRWAFTKPTVDWIKNSSRRAGAKANFEFIGHKVDFYFQTGPHKGIFEFTINEEEAATPAQVDCFSATSGEVKLVSVDTNDVQTNKIRFKAIGLKNPASSSEAVEIVRAEYHQILVGQAEDEQFYSTLSNTFTVGP